MVMLSKLVCLVEGVPNNSANKDNPYSDSRAVLDCLIGCDAAPEIRPEHLAILPFGEVVEKINAIVLLIKPVLAALEE